MIKKKIVFTGGGTLGHVMPNIYLFKELQKNYDCFYIGSCGIEKNKIKDLMPYYEISSAKLDRGKWLTNFKIPFVLFRAILEAKKILKKIKPDVIFSKGGYVALPVCIVGRMLKIPIVSHESDSSFGLANKLILKLCNVMCVNFKELENNKKIIYTGPILGTEFDSDKRDVSKLNLDTNKPTMLIIGGSLGSKLINKNICVNLAHLLKDFNIIHITGKNNREVESYANYNSFEMVDDIVNLYNIADFVVGRSGAGVTAECFYKQLPMLLIPLENGSTRGDQVLNAEFYVKLGVAKILREKDLNSKILLKEIYSFYGEIAKYKKKYKDNKINGRKKVIDIIEKY